MTAKVKMTKKIRPKKSVFIFNNFKSILAIFIVGIITVFGVKIMFASHAATLTVNFPPVAIGGSGSNDGYWLVASDGGVFSQGTAKNKFYGSMGGQQLNQPVDGIVATPDFNGYWLVAKDGGVFAFGNAQSYGALPPIATVYKEDIVSLVSTQDGKGYWLVSNYGRVWGYGDATGAQGNAATVIPGVIGTQPTWNGGPLPNIVAAVRDSRNNGIWEVSNSGGIYAYNGANYLNAPTNVSNIIGITSDPTGEGYWIIGSDGGVHNYGSAGFFGSMGGQQLNGPVVGASASSTGKGYWLTASDGGVFSFGDAQFQGAVIVVPPKPTPSPKPSPTPSPTPATTPTVTIRNGASLGSANALANGQITSTTTGTIITATNSGAPAPSDPTVIKVSAPAIGILADGDNSGYWELTTDGGVFGRGNAGFHGSAGSNNVTNIVGMARPDNSSNGYFLVGSDGGVFAYNLPFSGSMGGKHLNKPVVGIAATPDGKGYWLAGADGGVFAFGDAGFFGSMGGKQLNAEIVSIATTPDGKGYWLVASDGGVFAFGDAGFFGSMGNKILNKPIVGIATTPDGKGYWLVASDGGIFSFGNASYFGSIGGKSINGWAVGIAATPDGKGYYIQSSDGAVFAFGDAQYNGRLFYPPPSINMTANPTPIFAGSPLKVSWQVANGINASVFLAGDGVAGGYNVNDSTTVTPNTLGLSPYTLTVIGAGGTVNLQVVVNVVPPPPTATLFTSPSIIQEGNGSILEWSTTSVANATITMSGGSSPGFTNNVAPSGNQVLGNLGKGTYNFTITATNASGTTTQSTQLTVNSSSSTPVGTDPSILAGSGGAGATTYGGSGPSTSLNSSSYFCMRYNAMSTGPSTTPIFKGNLQIYRDNGPNSGWISTPSVTIVATKSNPYYTCVNLGMSSSTLYTQVKLGSYNANQDSLDGNNGWPDPGFTIDSGWIHTPGQPSVDVPGISGIGPN